MGENLVIEELTGAFSCTELEDIDALMRQLSPDAECTEAQLRRVMDCPDSHLCVLRCNGRIAGCITVCVMHTSEKDIAGIEALVVSNECRGKGYGRRLMEYAVGISRSLGLAQIQLTSNPKRVAANGLYVSMGFERYQTNCYRMKML